VTFSRKRSDSRYQALAWSADAAARLRQVRVEIMGDKSRSVCARVAGLHPTTIRKWEYGEARPDFQKLAYLLSWWSVRLGWVLTGEGPVVPEHKLHDVEGLIEERLDYRLAGRYLAAMLRGSRARYAEYAEELEAADEGALPSVIARTALYVISDLLSDPPEHGVVGQEHDYDALQLALTHAESALGVAEGRTAYRVRKGTR